MRNELSSNIWRVFSRYFCKGKFNVANVGSNPALYGFEYENSDGINLSIGRSGLDMDMAVLKNYSYLLKKNATILIPIIPFYSILGDAKDTMLPQERYAFYKILSRQLCDTMEVFYDIDVKEHISLKKWMKMMRSFIIGKTEIENMDLSCQPMTNDELEADAKRFCENRKKEFQIEDFNEPLTPLNATRRKKSIKHMCALINFCKEHNFNPVIVLMPMTEHLLRNMSDTFLETYVYSFVKPVAQETNTPIMDYTKDEHLTRDELYCNSLFLNRKGAHMFTKQVLKDIQRL